MGVHALIKEALKRVRQGRGLGTLVTLSKEAGLLQVLGAEDPEAARTKLMGLIGGLHEPGRALLRVVFNCDGSDLELTQRRKAFVQKAPGVVGSISTFTRLETEYLEGLTKQIAEQFESTPRSARAKDRFRSWISGPKYYTWIDFRESDALSLIPGLGSSHFRFDYDAEGPAGPHVITLDLREPPVNSSLSLSNESISLSIGRFEWQWQFGDTLSIRCVRVRLTGEVFAGLAGSHDDFPSWLWGIQEWERRESGFSYALGPVKQWKQAPMWAEADYTFERKQYHVLALMESRSELKNLGGELVDDAARRPDRSRL